MAGIRDAFPRQRSICHPYRDGARWHAARFALILRANRDSNALSAAKAAAAMLSEHSASRLSVADAVKRMEVDTQPFPFFLNTENDRGAVLYLRYDGHYGVITPE